MVSKCWIKNEWMVECKWMYGGSFVICKCKWNEMESVSENGKGK